MLLSLLLQLVFVSHCLAKTVEYHWTTGWGSADVDGQGERPVITCNGEFPWPDIRVTKGDTMLIYLTNGFNDSSTTTSLHMHGLFQEGTSQMDGPPMVVQCPIQPGDTLLYNFTVSSNVGLYWYHSHTEGQYEDGFRALLVVDDGENNENFPYDYDEEMVMSMGEWYEETVAELIPKFMSLYNPTGAEPIPRNVILNNTMNLTWEVQPDTTYLLRLGNFGGFVSQYFWIEDHEMTVVEVDGVYTEKNTTDMLYITVGQRYSVLIHTKNDTSRNFAMMQKFDDGMLDVIPDELMLNATSFLTYNTSAPQPEQNIVDELDYLDDFYLVPYNKIPLYDDPDYVITLDVAMDNLDNGINYAFFNNITYTAPKVPTLMTALTPGEDATNPLVYGTNTNTFVLQRDEIVEIVLNNLDTGTHPFHLHGHVFQTIIRDKEYDADEGLDPVAFDPDNHDDYPEYPMLRDTIYLRGQSNFVIRFKADNPGVWLFHCHIEWHLLQGLNIVLVEDPLSLQSNDTQQLTANMLDVCANSNISTKGNAADNYENFLDLTGENIQEKSIPEGFTKKGIIAMVFSCIAGILGLVTISLYGMMDMTPEQETEEIAELLPEDQIHDESMDRSNSKEETTIKENILVNQQSAED